MNHTGGQKKQRAFDTEGLIERLLIIGMLLFFFIFLFMPIVMMFGHAFEDDLGNYVGLENFRTYFATPTLAGSLWHSLTVSLITAALSTLTGLLFAYGITRTNIRGGRFYRYAALLSLFVPTMVHGMALVYIFGRTGFVTKILKIDIGLYGFKGVVMAELFYTFPQAFTVLAVALENADNRLYESAEVLGAGPVRTFFEVTLPSIRYGLINSFIVCFTLSFTDFGAPEVVGGNYGVLATDIFRQVAGQQKMSMGAVVGIVLTIPAVLSFVVNLLMQKKNERSQLSSKAVALQIVPSRGRDVFYQIFCTVIVACIFLMIGAVFLAAFATNWPYKMQPTLKHFDFGAALYGTGAVSFLNSFWLSFGTAALGTAIVFLFAYLIEKTRVMPHLRSICRFLSLIPMALPGLVLGLGYIMFFNKPVIRVFGAAIPNPFTGMYGTFSIMIFCTIIHMFSVTFVTAETALQKLDREYENVAQSINVPFWKIFGRVSLPMSINAVAEIFMYYFVNSMVTVSAIVFLFTPQNKPASIAILNMDDNGDFAAAAAMSILILLINIGVRLVYEVINVRLVKKLDAWKAGVI